VLKNASILRDEKGLVIGAVETFTDISEVVTREEQLARIRKELSKESSFEGIVGKSQSMQKIFDLIKIAANSDAPVLITGQTGTGKELVAQAIHRLSKGNERPFIRVNCAALNEQLLESELFGHVKGAFTGAIRTRVGRFEAAHGGTLFLDEIGDFPPSAQVKLLRAIQEKEIERVGDNRPITVDVRIVSATNKDRWAMVRQGRFREDLFYRIAVIPIELPSLAERKEDIPLLIDHFLVMLNAKSDRRIKGVSKAFLERLMAYEWPGNIRELTNVLEYAFAVCNRDILDLQDLPGHFLKQGEDGSQRREISKEILVETLRSHGWNRTKASKSLGLSRVTLWKKMKEFGLLDEDTRKQVKEVNP
jgi:transcriptional regulator with PAS, ATPase and Fis domain